MLHKIPHDKHFWKNFLKFFWNEQLGPIVVSALAALVLFGILVGLIWLVNNFMIPMLLLILLGVFSLWVYITYRSYYRQIKNKILEGGENEVS